jgi:hypothetical protein
MKLIMIEQPEAVQNIKLDWFNRRDGLVASSDFYSKELINIDANRDTFINSFTAALIEQMQQNIT